MRVIEEIPKEQIEEMSRYYDPLHAGICIQKYLETEDGKGDFIPVYANRTFMEIMGIPYEFAYTYSLRQITQEFPDKQLQDMVNVAFDGRVIVGDSFSADYSKYFSVRIYQYRYGYTINFMSDVTVGHITSSTSNSLSRVYEEIYYGRVSNPMCSKVYPSTEKKIEKITYEEMVDGFLASHNFMASDKLELDSFLNKRRLCDALATEDSCSTRFRMYSGDGYQWFVAEVIVCERNDSNVVAFVITIKNINDIVKDEIQKQQELEESLETVKKAKESKDKFLAYMSHDLRTPLNGILGMIQIMESEELSEDIRAKYLSKIRNSTENLLSLFNGVLDITRLESANIKLDKSSFDFRHLKKDFEIFSSKYGVKFIISFPEMKYPMRLGPEEYIRQIAYQLISNAVKFNKEDNPIEITVREVAESNFILFRVMDHGMGMSPEFQTQIFEPFSQENGGARTTYEGSGIGLTYVKKIVEELEGTISFESLLGEGTLFEVRIPLEIDKGQMQQEEKEYSEVSLDGKHCLLVEDNDINAMVAEMFVKSVGMTVIRAENGKEALDQFTSSREGEYDVILMDIMMPIMNGIEATEAIRKSNHPDAQTVPIIAVSANTFPEDIEAGMAVGMNAYLPKPLNKVALIEAMQKFIR